MILYTSDNDSSKSLCARTGYVYLWFTLLTALFGGIYEHFSHEVYSFYMIYAFAFPLAGGALPFTFLSRSGTKTIPHTLSRSLYHAGIATLTIGSIMTGVFEIYGTQNTLVTVYWFVGFAFLLLGLSSYVHSALSHK